MPTIVKLGSAAVAALLLLFASPRATAIGLGLGQLPRYEDPQASFAWEGSSSTQEVRFPSARTGAVLYGVLFTPKPAPAKKVPAVVIVPGSGSGVQSFYQWAARDLAGHGYVALTVDPQGVGRSDTFGSQVCGGASSQDPCPGVPWQQAANYVDAFVSGIDYVVRNTHVDRAHIGVAGHSLAARAASYVQGTDRRIGTIVAWDNLASSLEGDAGSPSGGPPLSEIIGGEVPSTTPHPVQPRVPALGMSSDNRGTGNPADSNPDLKKTAYTSWKRHGTPVMELVFAGAGHLDWAQTRIKNNEDQLHMFAYYTRAWFDRFLKADGAATSRLLARTVLSHSRAEFLSTNFRSGASFPFYDCEDLRRC